MVRSFLVALLVSIAVCVFIDHRARQKVEATEHLIAQRQAELQKLADLDRQVQAFQAQKKALQKRIDIVNQLYAAWEKTAK